MAGTTIMGKELEIRGKSCTNCEYYWLVNEGKSDEAGMCVLGDTCYDDLDDDLKEMGDE